MKMMTELREYRKSKGLTREDLALKSGVAKVTIQKLEDGDVNVNDIKLSTLIKLATALRTKARNIVDKETAKRL